jgi:hypothetical protein
MIACSLQWWSEEHIIPGGRLGWLLPGAPPGNHHAGVDIRPVRRQSAGAGRRAQGASPRRVTVTNSSGARDPAPVRVLSSSASGRRQGDGLQGGEPEVSRHIVGSRFPTHRLPAPRKRAPRRATPPRPGPTTLRAIENRSGTGWPWSRRRDHGHPDRRPSRSNRNDGARSRIWVRFAPALQQPQLLLSKELALSPGNPIIGATGWLRSRLRDHGAHQTDRGLEDQTTATRTRPRPPGGGRVRFSTARSRPLSETSGGAACAGVRLVIPSISGARLRLGLVHSRRRSNRPRRAWRSRG